MATQIIGTKTQSKKLKLLLEIKICFFFGDISTYGILVVCDFALVFALAPISPPQKKSLFMPKNLQKKVRKS